MSKKFQRKIENFTCQYCGKKVQGNGYTNHCPNCLWSRHVDINPGDRKEPCNGMMRPINLEIKKGRNIIIHQCQKCGAISACKTADNDNTGALIRLSKSIAKKMMF